jgi:hypothetical protein
MKKILISILCVGLLSACEKKLEEYAINPNDPENSTPALLLTGAEVATFAVHSGNLARVPNLFTQHVAGTSDQFADYARYDLNDQNFVNEWNTVYTNALINTRTLLQTYGNGNPYYSGMAKVLTAMNLGVATDLFGDVPYSDALKGLEKNYAPKYDTQEQIIQSIQSLLSDAITDFGAPVTANTNIPALDDLIFGGDIAKWTKSAYILKARYHNRLSQISPSQSATDALKAISDAGLSGNSDDMNAVFFDEPASLNQWAAFMSERGYIRMGKFFVDYMKSTFDPRLTFFAAVDDAGGYSGTAVDDQTTESTSSPGPGIASNDSPLPLVTYTEAKFIQAEAYLRLNMRPEAAAAFNQAVKASVLRVTGVAAPLAFEIAIASETALTISLEKIIRQKYVALFTQLEPYNDWRRTGFPVLTPNSAGVEPKIPLRLPSSQEERLYNPNATIVTDIYAPVWWDK